MQSGFAAKTTNRAKARPNNIREINNGFEFFSTRLVKNKKKTSMYIQMKRPSVPLRCGIYGLDVCFFLFFFFLSRFVFHLPKNSGNIKS